MNRKNYLMKRICGYFLTIFLILVFNFVLIRVMPGDPMMYILGEEDYYDFFYNNPSYLEELREVYDLNGSVIHQFYIYLKDIIQLDFGTSYHYGRPVLELILFRASWTLRLVIPAILISAVLGILGGLPAGWHWGKRREQGSTFVLTVLHTIPTYCLSIILLSAFSYQLGWFPQGNMVSGGKSGVAYVFDMLWHMLLPLLVLIIYRTSYDYLILRSNVRDIKDEPYIITAFSKGLTQRNVLLRHVLPNAFFPYVTVVFMQFGAAVAGTMTMEVIYNWSGMGSLIYDAVNHRDFPILQTAFLIIAVFTVLANLMADLVYICVDPRIRKENEGI